MMTEAMTAEAKFSSPWLSQNQLATGEFHKLIWEDIHLNEEQRASEVKLLLETIAQLRLWHLGFTFISNCIMPGNTSHIS